MIEKENISKVDKREWEGCINIAIDLLEFTGIAIDREKCTIDEHILYQLGRIYKDAALSKVADGI